MSEAKSNRIEIIIPNQGLTITEVTIARWHKKVGDYLKKGESILDFESEKSLVELDSPAEGLLSQIIVRENEDVAIGAVVGIIEL